MKVILSALVIGLLLVAWTASAQIATTTNQAPSVARLFPNKSSSIQSPLVLMQPQGPAVPVPAAPGTAPLKWWPILNSTTNSTGTVPLKPGLYQTKPFSCLVLVAPPHLDDRSVIGSGPSGSGTMQMPTIKPDLQFQPYSPGK
jgi:hypothetical protein